MKTEQEVIEQIKDCVKGNECFLNMERVPLIDGPIVSVIQKELITKLSTLYWVIEKKRPKFKCDE